MSVSPGERIRHGEQHYQSAKRYQDFIPTPYGAVEEEARHPIPRSAKLRRL